MLSLLKNMLIESSIKEQQNLIVGLKAYFRIVSSGK